MYIVYILIISSKLTFDFTENRWDEVWTIIFETSLNFREEKKRGELKITVNE